PVGAPGRPPPQRAGPQRDESEQRPGRGERARHHPREARVERKAEPGPERHHHVDEHRHPRRRHVDEDDAVGLALLRVGGRDQQADIEADDRKHRGRKPAGDRQLAGERVESLRRRVPEPPHSDEILRAAAVAQGANATATISMAPRISSCPWPPRPAEAISTAPAPITSTGTYSGSTSSASSTPPPRTPRVSAAPMPPIKLSTGVPSSNDKASTP